jgi:MATE family multidrug resistance protein
MTRLAVPVVAVQLGLMFMGVVDVVMVGRVSPQAIAAVALGNVYFFAVAIFGVGVLMALDPIVAQAVGALDEPAVRRGLQRGMVLATALALAASFLLVPAEPVLRLFRQPADVVPTAGAYARIMIAGMLPFYVFVVFRQTLQAMHRVAPLVVTIALANLANVGLNWAFIFGHLGLPPMGAVGAAWATILSRWVLALALPVLAWRHLRRYLLPPRRDALDFAALRAMARIGVPIGTQYQLEFGVFGVVGLLMGWLGTVPMAGHQVALNIASLTFMVPLGVSGAAAVLVGNAVGRGDAAEARRAAAAGLLIGVGFMALSAVVMLALPRTLAAVYTGEPAVAAVATQLIPLAGLFQVFDGTQVVSIGILRGVADTRAPMLVNILGYWLLGIPLSAWLGLRTGAGPRGLWWGLVVGLAVVALILLARVRSRLSREVRRVVIDREPAPAEAAGDP